jgi:putative hydrolase of the HAD superfamily
MTLHHDVREADADEADAAFAAAHAPILVATADEPFPPRVYGYTIFRAAGPSPSSKFAVTPRAAAVIEYAVWYDYDIAHLYDLEHVWVHVDAAGAVVAVEASRHGQRLDMAGAAVEAGHPVLAIETGKHAHWPTPAAMAPAHGFVTVACGRLAGAEGVHLGNRFAEAGLFSATPRERRIVRRMLHARRLVPDFSRWRRFSTATVHLTPWPRLAAWIPVRVRELIDAAVAETPHLAAVLLDCGDTLVDEASEVKMPDGEVVTAAHLVPGAREVVAALKAEGYPLALVADGRHVSFETVLGAHRLWDAFDARIISEDVGAEKPDPAMFAAALAALGLGGADAGRVVMVGNNLARDIAGANRAGLISVFMGWSPRRSHEPSGADEAPAHRIAALAGLPDLLARIEDDLARRR